MSEIKDNSVSLVVGADSMTWMGYDGNVYSYTLAPPQRVCTNCRLKFEWDGSEFKTLCLPCYGANARKCLKCKINNLKIGAPSWQVLCTDCYIAKKGTTFGTCPTCPPERATHLRRPLNAATCPECNVRLLKAPRANQ